MKSTKVLIVRHLTKFDTERGLIFKLKSYGVNVIFLKSIENYLTGRQQRVVLSSQISSWKNIPAGVSQGSVLGPHLI